MIKQLEKMGLIPQQLYNLTNTLCVAGIMKLPKSQHTAPHRINYGLVEIMDDPTFFMSGLYDAWGLPLSLDKFSPT